MNTLKTLFAALALCLCLPLVSARTHVPVPDFSNPGTTVEQAQEDYTRAIRSGNQTAQLAALMQLAKSEAMIDPDTRQKSTERILQWNNPKRPAVLQSLANMFAATLVRTAQATYTTGSSRGSVPQSPRPTNWDEWSTDMFNHVADSLATLAWQQATATPLAEIKDIVAADALSSQYYPQEADFVAGMILSHEFCSQQQRDSIYNSIIARHPRHSAPWYGWTVFRMQRRAEHAGSFKLFSPLKQLWLSAPNKDNAAAVAAALARLAPVPRDSAEKYIQVLEDAKTALRGSWAENSIANSLADIKSPRFALTVPRLAAPNCSISIDVENISMTDSISLVITPAAGSKNFSWRKVIEGNPRPTYQSRSASVALPAGKYLLTATALPSNHAVKTDTIVVTEAILNDIRSNGYTLFFVADAVNGAPLRGIPITITSDKDKRTLLKGVTDDNGTFGTDHEIDEHITVTAQTPSGPLSNEFYGLNDNMDVLSEDESEDGQLSASFSTDLPAYRPGDTVKWMAVVTNRKGVVRNSNYEVKLLDTDHVTVDSAQCVSDSWGRISGSFTLPSTGRTGYYTLNVKNTKTLSSANHKVSVMEYKPHSMVLDSVAAQPDTANVVTVTGLARTEAGVPVANAQVKVTVNIYGIDNNTRDFSPQQYYAAGPDGRFSVPVQYTAQKKDDAKVIVTVVSPDGNSATENVRFKPHTPYSIKFSSLPLMHNAANTLTFGISAVDAHQHQVPMPIKWKLVLRRESLPDSLITSGTINNNDSIALSTQHMVSGIYQLQALLPGDTEPTWRSFQLYNTGIPLMPYKREGMWAPTLQYDALKIAADNTVRFPVLMESDGIVRVTYCNKKGVIKMQAQPLKKGWNHTVWNVEGIDIDAQRAMIIACLNARVFSDAMRFEQPAPKLSVQLVGLRDRTTAGTRQEWSLRATDSNGRSVPFAAAVNVYDARLLRFGSAGSLDIKPAGGTEWYLWYAATPSWRNTYIRLDDRYRQLPVTHLVMPQWKWTMGLGFNQIRVYGYVAGLATRSGVMDMSANVAEAVKLESVAPSATNTPPPPLREGAQYSALWLTDAVSNENGSVDINFTLPPANTRWQVSAAAWTAAGISGTVDTTFTSSRPVMAAVAAPRFVRRADQLAVPMTVSNMSGNTLCVNCRLSVSASRNGAEVYSASRTLSLAAFESDTLKVHINLADPRFTDCDTVFVTGYAQAQGYATDAERIAIPVLSSQSTVTDAVNFYLGHGEDTYDTKLPQPHGQNWSLTLNYCGNPLRGVAAALPTLAGKEMPATANGQAYSMYAAAVTEWLAQKYPSIWDKNTLHNATKTMETALSLLQKSQRADGGWGWGIWSKESSLWTTLNVLSAFACLPENMPTRHKAADMINRALEYCDSHVKDVDMDYVAVRSCFDKPLALNGAKVKAATVGYILKNWRSMQPATCAEAAVVLHRSGNKAMARQLLTSVGQYGIRVPHKGMIWKRFNYLVDYATLLTAYNLIDPASPNVDGIREYLVLNRQSNSWGNCSTTFAVVTAMLTTGTRWPDSTAAPTLTIDGMPQKVEADRYTAQFTMPVQGHSLQLTRTDATTPAWGSVVETYTAASDSITPFSDGELSIRRYLLVQRNSNWLYVDSATVLKPGDRIRVQLAMRTSRPMTAVTVTDARPATLEPVNQIPGYVYADGSFMYRENRDAVTNFYVDYVPRGVWVWHYETVVTAAGTFGSGIATVTCDTAPTLTAHSGGTWLRITQ